MCLRVPAALSLKVKEVGFVPRIVVADIEEGRMLDISGGPHVYMPGTDSCKYVYIRTAVAHFMNAFAEGSCMWIKGPPGCGKSVVGLLLAYRRACEGARVLYVASRESADYVVEMVGGKWALYSAPGTRIVSATVELSMMYDVAILDGITRTADRPMIDPFTWLHSVPKKNASHIRLAISSGQVDMKSQETAALKERLFPSWTLPEYESALHAMKSRDLPVEELFSLECLAELRGMDSGGNGDAKDPYMSYVRKKYTVVGGSARLMFSLTTETAKSHLSKAIDSLNVSTAAVLIEWGILPLNDKFLNRLHSVYSVCEEPHPEDPTERYRKEKMMYNLLSQHVCRRLEALSLVSADGMRQLLRRSQSMNNAAVVGWVYEEYVHTAIAWRAQAEQPVCVDLYRWTSSIFEAEPCLHLEWYAMTKVRMDSKGSHLVDLHTEQDDAFHFDSYVRFPLYIRPSKSTFPTLDGILLERERTEKDGDEFIRMTSLQMTVGERHDVDLVFLVKVAKELSTWLESGVGLPLCRRIRHVAVLMECDALDRFRFSVTNAPTDRETRSGTSRDIDEMPWSVELYKCALPIPEPWRDT